MEKLWKALARKLVKALVTLLLLSIVMVLGFLFRHSVALLKHLGMALFQKIRFAFTKPKQAKGDVS